MLDPQNVTHLAEAILTSRLGSLPRDVNCPGCELPVSPAALRYHALMCHALRAEAELLAQGGQDRSMSSN
jgi:hypothetical protein